MKGFKTFIFGAANAALGAGMMFIPAVAELGVTLLTGVTREQLELVTSNDIASQRLGLTLIVIGAVVTVLRFVTSSPIFRKE